MNDRDHDTDALLGRAVQALPGTGGPDPATVRQRLGRRPSRARAAWWIGGAGALAAAAATTWIVLGVGGVGVRDRGLATSFGAVHLEAAAEDATGGLRALRSGDRVHSDERVVFRVETDAGGRLGLKERSAGGGVVSLYALAINAGQHVVGGLHPLAWEPNAGSGVYTYIAELCDTDRPDHCSSDRLTLIWAAR